MNAKHTPGPYSLVKAGVGEYPAKNGAVMSCEEVVGDLSDLLEALEAFVQTHEFLGHADRPHYQDAKRAIAKARGKA